MLRRREGEGRVGRERRGRVGRERRGRRGRERRGRERRGREEGEGEKGGDFRGNGIHHDYMVCMYVLYTPLYQHA